MQEVCINDKHAFEMYAVGHEVSIELTPSQDSIEDFMPGKMVDVFLITNTSKQHFIGSIIKNNGVVPSIPEVGTKAISITVQRIK